MNEQTRNLFPFAIQRTTMLLVILVFSVKDFLDDGSFTTTESELSYKARVIDLTPSEIQRLRDGGMTINSGISISITGELVKVPDYVKIGTTNKYRVIQYTYKEGVSILLVDSLQGTV